MSENFRPVTLEDAPALVAIYAPYVSQTALTFETEVPTLEEFRRRISGYTETFPWFVCEIEGEIVGYAYATAFRTRPAYRWSVESSVYVHEGHQGKGLGKKLYRLLIEKLQAMGVVNVIGVIGLPNDASIGLHESLGFKAAARFPQVGFKLGKWWDVGYWQLSLEKPVHPDELQKPKAEAR